MLIMPNITHEIKNELIILSPLKEINMDDIDNPNDTAKKNDAVIT